VITSSQKTSFFVLVLLLALSVTSSSVSVAEPQPDMLISSVLAGSMLYVGGSGPGNYTTIQDAINHATAGDTVFVFMGTYQENVVIGTSIRLLGENRSSTIIDGCGVGTVVMVRASDAIVQGFTIRNCKNQIPYAGIELSMASGVIVMDNIIRDNGGLGISASGPGISSVSISGNLILNNTYGVYILDSSAANITGNTFEDNGEGLYLVGVSHIRVLDNALVDNEGLGLHLERSFGSVIFSNSFINNKNGMYLFNASGNQIANNTVHGNRWYGIWLKDSSDNVIETNNISGNVDLGLYLDTSFENTISFNTLIDNDNGIYFKDSSQNIITKNTLKNDKFNADFVTHTLLHSGNSWRSNYWERPRLLPYPVLGTYKVNNTPHPWIAFDWTPLRSPPTVSQKTVSSLAGAVLYVGGSGPNNYSMIQDAIDDASANDTVYVFNGTYHQTFIINKSLRILGENKTTTVLDGDGLNDVLTIVADYVSVSGFTIQNSHFDICINHSMYANISGNNINNALQGVSIQDGCTHLAVYGNSFQENVYGLRLYSSAQVTVSFNSFQSFKVNAYFFGTALWQGRSHWFKNFWGSPRQLPYPIFGKIRIGGFSLVWLNFDWAPLTEPVFK
jgi:parallel beta-helix repeat protein